MTDDTTALITMRDAIRTAQATDQLLSATILFGQRKCYKYTSNRWTWGIRRLRLLGNGSSFQNVSSDPYLGEKHVFMANRDPFQSNGIGEYWRPRTAAYLIHSASAGDTTVKVITPSDATNFMPGQWALVYSRDQQFGGYPPNPRNFDYVRVLSAHSSTGAITLDRPLERSHSSTAPEITQTIPVGRARIIPIEDQDISSGIAFGETLYAENMRFLNNPNNPSGDYQYTQNRNQVYFDGYETVTLVNITGPTLVVSQSKYVHVINSHWYEVIADKIVRSLVMTNCTVDDGISEGTGVDTITLIGGQYSSAGGKLLRPPVALTPRQLLIEDIACDSSAIQPPTQPAINIASRMPVRLLEIKNTRCLGSGPATGHVLGNYNSTLKLIAGTDAVISGPNQLTVNITAQGSIQQKILSCLEEGTFAGILTEPEGQEIGAEIRSVAGNRTSENAIVDIDSTHSIVEGDVLVCHPILASNIKIDGLVLTEFSASPFYYMPSP